MPLESLLELVKTLSDRIDRHGPALRQSEALTRYALIDPLLRELGWDTANPGMVIPEYRSGNGRADYALMHNSSPAMMVEAKSLGTPLRDTVLSQGINYCLMEGTSYFAVTDGRLWEIYETHKPVPINDKRIVQFDLKADPAQVCLKALALWQPSAESGDIATAQTPVVELIQPQQSILQPETRRIPTDDTQPEPVIPVPENGEWLPLSEFKPKGGDKPPAEILFPDNTTAPIKNWRSVTEEAAKWLVHKNLLRTAHCPIQFSSSRSRYVANTAPIHPSGKHFFAQVQVGSIFIETHANASQGIRKAMLIIKSVGQDPSQFKVRLS